MDSFKEGSNTHSISTYTLMKNKNLVAALLLFLVTGCAGQTMVQKSSETIAPASNLVAAPTPEPEKPRPTELIVFYVPHSEAEASEIVDVLSKNPSLKVTLLFPPHYFEVEEHANLRPAFKVLQSSHQIEIGLTINNQPNLALLTDLSLAGPTLNFKWPDDVGGQLAQASGHYQKLWGQLPAGFAPPYFAFTKQSGQELKHFRFDWLLAKPQAEAGVQYVGDTIAIVPQSAEFDAISFMKKGGVYFVDANHWENPSMEKDFLHRLASDVGDGNTGVLTQTAREWVGELHGRFQLPEDHNVFEQNFSNWVVTDKQRLAWRALDEARTVLEKYKNSGRANLRRLDAAFEEIHSAESGDFLLSLGQTQASLGEQEKSFVATLSNVYRLCEVSVPSQLNTWFTNPRWKKIVGKTVGTAQDAPFFVAGTSSYRWNDAKGDDNGNGSLIYPLGKYPNGAFDLQSFVVSWTDDDVTFTAVLGGLALPTSHIVNPLIDVYVDVNRLSGAGSAESLKGRSNIAVDRDAAWEFAVSMTPARSFFYQAIPGKSARVVQSIETKVEQSQKSIQAVLPRSIVRGNPANWRFSVSVLAAESGQVGTDIRPAMAQSTASDRAFGGQSLRSPAVLDVLIEGSDAQQKKLADGVSKWTLPYVEP